MTLAEDIAHELAHYCIDLARARAQDDPDVIVEAILTVAARLAMEAVVRVPPERRQSIAAEVAKTLQAVCLAAVNRSRA